MFKLIFAAIAGFAVGSWFVRHESHPMRRDAALKAAIPSNAATGNPSATPPPTSPLGANKRV